MLQRKTLKQVKNDIKQKDMDPMLDTHILQRYILFLSSFHLYKKMRKSYFIPVCLKPTKSLVHKLLDNFHFKVLKK